MPADVSPRYTAVIADDHEIVRSGLAAALAAPGVVEHGGIRILAHASHGLEAIELVKEHRPDLLLLDVTMPLASGAEILTDIKRWSPDTRIVVLTAVTSPGLLSGLVEGGVHGLFSKASDSQHLFDKLPLILRGGRYVEERLVAILQTAAPPPRLSDRERQTLNMIVAGKTNGEMAEIMGISPRTAEKHRASLMGKMGVRSAVELLSRALQDGLIEEQRPQAPAADGPDK